MFRARETARIAGFGDRDVVRDELREYDYGHYEASRTRRSGRNSPRGSCPATGCPPARRRTRCWIGWTRSWPNQLARWRRAAVRSRALLPLGGARFLGLPIQAATGLRLDAGTLSILSTGATAPSLVLWNRHVPPRAAIIADIATAIARATP